MRIFNFTFGYCLVTLVMVFNTTFNNISVLLVEKTRVPIENHRPAASHRQTLSHNVVSSTPCCERGSNSQRWTQVKVNEEH